MFPKLYLDIFSQSYLVQPHVTHSLSRYLYQLMPTTSSILRILVYSYSSYLFKLVYYVGLSLVRCSYLSVGSLQFLQHSTIIMAQVNLIIYINDSIIGYQAFRAKV